MSKHTKAGVRQRFLVPEELKSLSALLLQAPARPGRRGCPLPRREERGARGGGQRNGRGEVRGPGWGWGRGGPGVGRGRGRRGGFAGGLPCAGPQARGSCSPSPRRSCEAGSQVTVGPGRVGLRRAWAAALGRVSRQACGLRACSWRFQ